MAIAPLAEQTNKSNAESAKWVFCVEMETGMANNLFQNMMYQLKDVIGRKIGVLDDTATAIASSDISMLNLIVEPVEEMLGDTFGIFVCEGYTYKVIGVRNKVEYIVFVEGEDEEAKTYCSMIAVSISNLKQLYDEKYDKANFIKNIILDNILPGDIHLRVKELRIPAEVDRVAFLIRVTEGEEVSIFDIVQNMFPEKNKDFIISLNEQDIVLIKEVKAGTTSKELEKVAKAIVDTIGVEVYVKINIGIGTIVDNIKELARSFKEAQVALEVGKVFDTEKNIVNYDNLGIGRLIYHLPTRLCEMFLSEIFKKESIDVLDQETIITIQKFFENSLNVSETARKLYVHRNTLVYRLDKIYKLTGLDLRLFDDAIVFKVAMMVKKYLVSKPMKI